MGIVTRPFTFTNGTVADATEVNSNENTLYTVVNGNLDQANLATDSVNTSEIVNAAVTDVKIAFGTGAGQVSGVDLPIADAGAFYPTDNVESALQEISQGTRATSWQINRGAANFLTMTHAALTAPRIWTHSDVSDTYVGLTAIQTLINKTLTSPDINGGTWNGTIDGAWTAAGQTCANLGIVTTADINGGTLDGTVIGATTAAAATVTSLTTSSTVIVGATQRIYLDGGGDTYITEPIANQVDVYTAGTAKFRIGAGGNVEVLLENFILPATKYLYLDGGGDTYIYESAANSIGLVAGGSQRFGYSFATGYVSVSSASLAVPSGNVFALDGGGDTYIYESAANQVDLIVGAAQTFRARGEGILLPAIDPPTANYANRNGIVKAWAFVSSAGAVLVSYNVSSATRDAAGRYTVVWNTDFSSVNYAVLATGEQAPAVVVRLSVHTNITGVGSSNVTIWDNAVGAYQDSDFFVLAIGTQ